MTYYHVLTIILYENCMLQICSKFAENYSLTFNSKKIICMKFLGKVKLSEKIKLNGSQTSWVAEIKQCQIS